MKLLPSDALSGGVPLARIANRESPLDEYTDGDVTEMAEVERTSTALAAWYGAVGGGLRIVYGLTVFFILFGLTKPFELAIKYDVPYFGSGIFLWNIAYALTWGAIFEGFVYVIGALVIACSDDASDPISRSGVRNGYSYFRTVVDVGVQLTAIFFVGQAAGMQDATILFYVCIARTAVVFFMLAAFEDNASYHRDIVLGDAVENDGFSHAPNYMNNVVLQFAFLLLTWAPILLYMILSVLNSPGDTTHWIMITVPLTGAAVDIFAAICLTLRYTRLGGRFINWLRLPRAYEAIETITTTVRTLYFLSVVLIAALVA